MQIKKLYLVQKPYHPSSYYLKYQCETAIHHWVTLNLVHRSHTALLALAIEPARKKLKFNNFFNINDMELKLHGIIESIYKNKNQLKNKW